MNWNLCKNKMAANQCFTKCHKLWQPHKMSLDLYLGHTHTEDTMKLYILVEHNSRWHSIHIKPYKGQQVLLKIKPIQLICPSFTHSLYNTGISLFLSHCCILSLSFWKQDLWVLCLHIAESRYQCLFQLLCSHMHMNTSDLYVHEL